MGGGAPPPPLILKKKTEERKTRDTFIGVEIRFQISHHSTRISKIQMNISQLNAPFYAYQTHCDICPMSHRVASSTSGKIQLKTGYFLQNIAFLSQSRRFITNAHRD